MKLGFQCLIVFFTFFLLNTVFSQNTDYEGLTVKKISFVGLTNAHSDEVHNLIALKEGDKYTADAMNDSLKKLFSLDMFKDATVDVSKETNGLFITFTVQENSFIRNIRFEGNDTLRMDDLLKEIEFTQDSFFSTDKATRSLIALKNKYIKEGFIESDISYKLNKVDETRNIYDLILKIKEGNKIVVEKIVIKGNKQVPDNDIKGAMKTKERFLIFNSGVLKDEEYSKDKEMVEEFYKHKGFLDIEVKRFTNDIEQLDNDKHKAIVIYIDVVEGDKYFFGNYSIKGNSIFSTEELAAYMDFKPGEVYDKTKMDMARYNIFNKYSDSGHVFANVTLLMNKSTNKVVDTEFVIVEGPRAHIEKLTVSGNSKTLDKVVRREFVMNEGELYIQRKVRQSMEKLMQTQFFSDVKPAFFPGSAEGLINMDFKVEEQRTGMVSFGLGYGTTSGFNVSGSLTEKNLFGTGRFASIKGTFGQTVQSLSLDYVEPYVFDQPMSIGASVYFTRNVIQNVPTDSNNTGTIDGTSPGIQWKDPTTGKEDVTATNAITNNNYYFNDSLGASVTLSRLFWIYWKGSVGLGTAVYRNSFDNNDLQNFFLNSAFSTSRTKTTSNLTNENPLYPDPYTGYWTNDTNLVHTDWALKNNFVLGAEMNSTDNPLAPLYGNKFSLYCWYFGGLLGGSTHYIRPKLSFDQYINLFWKVVLALHVSEEFLLPQFGQSEPIFDPTTDGLYFDGSYEMRGFTGYYGNQRFQAKSFYSMELRSQIFGDIWGVLFSDLGNVWSLYSDFRPFSPNGYLFSCGIGVQLNIAMFPIRVYVARTAIYDTPGQGWRFNSSSQNFFDISGWTPVINITGLF